MAGWVDGGFRCLGQEAPWHEATHKLLLQAGCVLPPLPLALLASQSNPGSQEPRTLLQPCARAFCLLLLLPRLSLTHEHAPLPALLFLSLAPGHPSGIKGTFPTVALWAQSQAGVAATMDLALSLSVGPQDATLPPCRVLPPSTPPGMLQHTGHFVGARGALHLSKEVTGLWLAGSPTGLSRGSMNSPSAWTHPPGLSGHMASSH